MDTQNATDTPAPASAGPGFGTEPPSAVTQRKFVRVTEKRANDLVAFEFSVGWPDLSVELVMPQPMFDDFCARHQVEFLTEPVGEKLGDERGND